MQVPARTSPRLTPIPCRGSCEVCDRVDWPGPLSSSLWQRLGKYAYPALRRPSGLLKGYAQHKAFNVNRLDIALLPFRVQANPATSRSSTRHSNMPLHRIYSVKGVFSPDDKKVCAHLLLS